MDKKEIVLAIVLIFFIFANIVVLVKVFSLREGIAGGATHGEIYFTIGSSAANETPVTPPGAVVGGGGGGAALKFSTDPEVIKVELKQGGTLKQYIKIINLNNFAVSFYISQKSLDDYVQLSDKSIIVPAGGEKSFYAVFLTKEDTEPGVKTGKIIVKAAGASKEIPVVLEIESKEVLFDVTLDIPAKYRKLLPGDDLVVHLTLFNLIGGKRDVSIIYVIQDFDGKEIIKQDEVVAVETQASFSRTINLPQDLKIGEYVAIAYAKYGYSVGSSSKTFEVVSELEFPLMNNIWTIIIIAIIIIILILVLIMMNRERKLGKLTKVQDKTIRDIREKKNEIFRTVREIKKKRKEVGVDTESRKVKGKINSQIGALERAKKAGYVSKSSYDTVKSRLQKLKKGL